MRRGLIGPMLWIGLASGSAAAHADTPTLQVVGIAVDEQTRIAFLALLDSGGKAIESRKVAEGETFADCRVLKVLPDRVLLERGGEPFVVRLGHARSLDPQSLATSSVELSTLVHKFGNV